MSPARERLLSLSACRDDAALRSAFGALCAEFGEVRRLRLLTTTEAERRHALFFLRLDSPTHEWQLMLDLGASRFGDDLLVIVELQPDGA